MVEGLGRRIYEIPFLRAKRLFEALDLSPALAARLKGPFV